MLPNLPVDANLPEVYRQFLQNLQAAGFGGDVCTDLATRISMATDNSIFQLLPKAVIFPKSADDIGLMFRLASETRYREVAFSPRGAGTGTNGQSLTMGIIVDCSRHMHAILEINPQQRWIRVQPGVVLDELNAAVKPHGLFFAPTLSTSSRATMGGMFNTDACGKGSCLYGRTSQHVLAATSVLTDGSLYQSQQLSKNAWQPMLQQPGLLGQVYQVINSSVIAKQAQIQAQLPKLVRHITGYNLAKVYDAESQSVNLNYLLSGSEGTLAVTTELTLQLTAIPRYKCLIAINYLEFDDALQAARSLLVFKPAAVETIDDKILAVAKLDEIYLRVQPLLAPQGETAVIKAINLVELVADDQAELDAKATAILAVLKAEQDLATKHVGYYLTDKPNEIEALWDLRKKSVGLLANIAGQRRPVPFVEDTAVPPEHLADFVREFRALLDHYQLSYGMFGHVDAGCLHVRPSLDMTNEQDANLVPVITAAVQKLVKKYGGVLWSEHGAGYRSSYLPEVFGELYEDLRLIKTAFDPYNQLNPGKLVTSLHNKAEVVKIAAGHYRGDYDRQIPKATRAMYQKAIECNGNAQCFAYQPHETICPSMKVTRDRLHSPKGRMAVLREWLRRGTAAGANLAELPKASSVWQKWLNGKQSSADFSSQVYQAMAGCLGCKACVSSCPVKVDVPHLRAKFLAHYHSRYRRPLRDYLLALSEVFARWQSASPKFANVLPTGFISRLFGLTALPKASGMNLTAELKRRQAPAFSLAALAALSPEQKAKTVCLLQDVTSAYEPQLVLAVYDLLNALGYTVYILPWRLNGKMYHHLGMLKRFSQVVRNNHQHYQQIAELNIAMLGIEPSLVLCYRDEYEQALGYKPKFQVQLLQEWLSQQTLATQTASKQHYCLFSHCSEKSLVNTAAQQWQQVFAKFGLSLNIVATGCCGMAGAYGHCVENQSRSQGIFALSWQQQLQNTSSDQVLVTGFSCRSQVARYQGFKPVHPVQALLAVVSQKTIEAIKNPA